MTHRDDDEDDDLAGKVEDELRRIAARRIGREPLEPPSYGPTNRPRRRWKGLGTAIGTVLILVAAYIGKYGLGTPHENPNHEPGSNGPRVEQAPATRRDANAWDTVYAQKAVTVRANRGTVYEAVRTLDPGEPVKVVSRDQSGWVLLYELDGHPIGYAFRSKASFGPHPPAPPPASLMQPQLILAAEHEPSPAPGPVDTTALCRDGAASFSRHSSGTCSGHGGVRCWLHHPGPDPPRGSPFCASRRPSQEPSTWRSASADR